MHSYYAFYIIAMIFAGIQFSIAVPSLAMHPYGGAVWQPVVTLIISVIAFSAAIIPTIIASKFIYCKSDITVRNGRNF